MTTPTKREALIALQRMCVATLRDIGRFTDDEGEMTNQLEQVADMLAADAPFAPDWTNYRQGVEDGKADAQQVAVPQEMVADYISELAEIRDMFPVPKHGGYGERAWCAAISSPENVPDYVRTMLAAPQPPQAGPVNDWKEAILNELAITCIDYPVDTPPKEILRGIIAMREAMVAEPFKAAAERYRSMGGRPKPD